MLEVQLGELLEATGKPLDHVIQLGVDDEALVPRISGRSTCGNCGEVYHDVTKPQPPLKGVCSGPSTVAFKFDQFKTAMKFVEGMKETTGLKEYSLNDFIIYTCLLDGVVFDG